MSKSSLARGLSQVNTDIMSVGARYGYEGTVFGGSKDRGADCFSDLERKCMRKVASSVLHQGFWLWICCRVGSHGSIYPTKFRADDSELLNPEMVTGLVVLHAERYLVSSYQYRGLSCTLANQILELWLHPSKPLLSGYSANLTSRDFSKPSRTTRSRLQLASHLWLP